MSLISGSYSRPSVGMAGAALWRVAVVEKQLAREAVEDRIEAAERGAAPSLADERARGAVR